MMRIPRSFVILAAVAVVAAGGAALGRWLDPSRRLSFGGLVREPPFAVPDFAFADAHGRRVARADLRGRPWIADFVFLQCDATCSAVTSRLADVAARVGGDGVRFVSFSVDAAGDELARYRDRVTHDPRWTFVATGSALPPFAVGMGAATSENDVPAAFVATSRYLFLVDGDGIVQRTYDGLDAGSAKRIVDDLAALGSVSAVAARAAGVAARAAGDDARAAGELPRMWPVPDFALVDQRGRSVTTRQLRGRPFIADFIFTSCAGACPLLTARMATLARQLADADVGFVSFSVDPAHDTPAALADYARRWHGDARWELLATTPASLAAVAAGMKVAVVDDDAAAGGIIHSDRFQLVDADGVVRGVYDSADEHAMARLLADARTLAHAGATARASKLPTDGAALYAALGCGGCHDDRRVAAPLAGLWGRRVTLDDGRSVVADDAYLRESIVDPRAKVAAGWPPTMPSYAGAVDGAQLDALVAYVKSLRTDGIRAAHHAVGP